MTQISPRGSVVTLGCLLSWLTYSITTRISIWSNNINKGQRNQPSTIMSINNMTTNILQWRLCQNDYTSATFGQIISWFIFYIWRSTSKCSCNHDFLLLRGLHGVHFGCVIIISTNRQIYSLSRYQDCHMHLIHSTNKFIYVMLMWCLTSIN